MDHDDDPDLAAVEPTSHAEALARMFDAEATLRAIGAGEIDAFVMATGGDERRVFTLATADRPYRMFVQNMRDGAATISASGVILFANQRLAELVGRDADTIVGKHLSVLVDGDVSALFATMVGSDRAPAAIELDLLHADGHAVPVLVASFPLTLGDDVLVCLTFGDLRDQRAQDQEIERLSEVQRERLSDLQAAQAALTWQATHDALTGLPERELLVDRINQALARAQRTGFRTGVYFVDLDRFKQVNDTQGHDMGDIVLRDVAHHLLSVVRPMDTVARVGGDEFVVVAPDLDSQLSAIDIGSRIVGELCRRPVEGEVEQVDASVGVAISVAGVGTAESMLKDADTAMYKAKSRGGARVEVFDAALGREARRTTSARRTLETALADGRVVVYFQPIVELDTGATVGFEALSRITDTDQSLVLPAAFIPVAEDSGLVVPLDRHVLDMACRAAQGWLGAGALASPPSIAVNLSARQFDSGDLPAIVSDCLAVSGLHPTRLHLELTETAILNLRPELLQQLAEITDLGVEVGLDDFGTGYASLTHLRRLPLTFIKIDQSFVQGLETGRDDERIVAAVVDLAAHLGLRSIAEGVETVHQLDRLRELGCVQAQGYYFARPLPEIEAVSATNWVR